MAIGTYEQYKERLLKMKPNVYLNGKCVDRSNGKEGEERDLADWIKGGTYVMKQCYAFYKKYCGRELAEEEWRDIVDGVQIYNQKWQNTWCRGLILALLSILEKEDKDRRGETSDEKQPEEGETEESGTKDSGTKDSGTKDSETEEGQQEMDTAA